jgi:hypothetical protein
VREPDFLAESRELGDDTKAPSPIELGGASPEATSESENIEIAAASNRLSDMMVRLSKKELPMLRKSPGSDAQ